MATTDSPDQTSTIHNRHSSIELSLPRRLICWKTDLRTIQELLGHHDVKTTEIYLNVATGTNGLGVVSLVDVLERG